MPYFSKRYHPPGTSPGTLVEHAPASAQPPRIRIMDYDAEQLEEIETASLAQCRAALATPTITWIDIQGKLAPDVLRELGALFELHPLAMEDVLNSGQRPKVERYDTQLFVIASLPALTDDGITVEQVSIFAGEGYVISFCNGGLDPFEPVRKRLRGPRGRMRSSGADYLLYALLDVVIDQGFPLLERFGERIEDLEDKLLAEPDRTTLAGIHTLKRELLVLRRMLWPQREVPAALLREEPDLIRQETRLYLRDCYDHAVQILDLLENYRDSTAAMLDVYLSSVSNRLNDVMRVLTVIATMFIPLTFVVGVYGMNFDRASPWNMPELGWRYGYPLVWLVMIALVVGMLIYFRRKRWL